MCERIPRNERHLAPKRSGRLGRVQAGGPLPNPPILAANPAADHGPAPIGGFRRGPPFTGAPPIDPGPRRQQGFIHDHRWIEATRSARAPAGRDVALGGVQAGDQDVARADRARPQPGHGRDLAVGQRAAELEHVDDSVLWRDW